MTSPPLAVDDARIVTVYETVAGHHSLDVMPGVECWGDDMAFWMMAAIASLGFALYACVLPAVLFCRLRAGVKAGRITDPEFVRYCCAEPTPPPPAAALPLRAMAGTKAAKSTSAVRHAH